MRIDGLPQQPKVSQAQQRGTAPRTRESTEESRDVVEISQQSVADLTALAKSASADNSARLQQIGARVRSGHYDSPEVRQRIADALLGSAGMGAVVGEVAQVQFARQQLQDVPEVRQDSVAQARERLASGYYDAPQVRRETANKMLDELA